jgi:hypothetical protein
MTAANSPISVFTMISLSTLSEIISCTVPGISLRIDCSILKNTQLCRAAKYEAEDRNETVKYVLQTARALTDTVDELLIELDKLGEMDVPEFVLGKLPESEPTPPLPVQTTFDILSPQERQFALQLCKDAGKDLDKLTEQEKTVLQMSLENFRSQYQRTAQMGHTALDGPFEPLSSIGT